MHADAYVDLQRRVAKRRSSARRTSTRSSRSSREAGGGGGRVADPRAPKHFYSIWKKMHDQGREFDEIYDLTAVRVLTNSVRDC